MDGISRPFRPPEAFGAKKWRGTPRVAPRRWYPPEKKHMENESRKKLDSKTRPFAGLIGCHEEKREAYTRLYKRQVMSL